MRLNQLRDFGCMLAKIAVNLRDFGFRVILEAKFRFSVQISRIHRPHDASQV